MNIFQSDNIWKRKARAEKAAQNPPTPHEQWESQLRSNWLWLIGGIIVVALYLVGLANGAIGINLTSVVVVVMVALYCLMSVKQILDLKKNEPDLTAAEKKKMKKKK